MLLLLEVSMNFGWTGRSGMARMAARTASLLTLGLTMALLLTAPTRTSAEAGLLSYSLSAAPVAASTIWNAASLLYYQARSRQSTFDSDAPIWARTGARNLQTRLTPASRNSSSSSLLDLKMFKTVRPGMGDLFDFDTAGREQLSGTRAEDVRWYYVKFKVFGDKGK